MKPRTTRTRVGAHALLACAAVLATALFHQYPLSLTILLCATAAAFLAITPHPRGWIVFLFASLMGPASEMVAVSSGAWHYAEPFVWGVPLWLFPLWGCAALLIIGAAYAVPIKR